MKYDDYYKLMYQMIMDQVDQEKQYRFGTHADIVILTDRLAGYADGVRDFLALHEDLTVRSVRSLSQVENSIKEHVPDIFLIVGYLSDPKLYDAVTLMREANPYVCVVIYARPDDCIESHQLYYHIEFMFSREAPLENLVFFLKDIFHKKNLEKAQSKFSVSLPAAPQKNEKKHIFRWYFHLNKRQKRT